MYRILYRNKKIKRNLLFILTLFLAPTISFNFLLWLWFRYIALNIYFFSFLTFLCVLAYQKNNTTLLRIQIQWWWHELRVCVCEYVQKKRIRLLLVSMFAHSKARMLFSTVCCCLFVSVRKFNYPMLKFNYLMRVCVVTKISFHFFHHKLKDLTQFFLVFRHHVTYKNISLFLLLWRKEIVEVYCSIVFERLKSKTWEQKKHQ